MLNPQEVGGVRMRKKGERVKGQGRSQTARKQVGGGHTASVQAAASKGFRSEWEKAVPQFLQEGGASAWAGPLTSSATGPHFQEQALFLCFINSVNETTVVSPCEGHGLGGLTEPPELT